MISRERCSPSLCLKGHQCPSRLVHRICKTVGRSSPENDRKLRRSRLSSFSSRGCRPLLGLLPSPRPPHPFPSLAIIGYSFGEGTRSTVPLSLQPSLAMPPLSIKCFPTPCLPKRGQNNPRFRPRSQECCNHSFKDRLLLDT